MKNNSGVCDKYPNCGKDVCYDPDVICPKLMQVSVSDPLYKRLEGLWLVTEDQETLILSKEECQSATKDELRLLGKILYNSFPDTLEYVAKEFVGKSVITLVWFDVVRQIYKHIFENLRKGIKVNEKSHKSKDRRETENISNFG